ncbi:hypothetical protein OSB04_007800 [Centaurea solstitialis]|uniref:Uncharacterized protein n=1 Tax=Centaurea solstitialis TaxID=347529 RepID=A0AA38WR23_9ASTR|nr:hypothetical protein OSB04_007800 [Centaurea solstitialis]
MRRGEYGLEDSYNQLRSRSSKDMKRRLNIRFQGEEPEDTRGLTKRVVSVAVKDLLPFLEARTFVVTEGIGVADKPPWTTSDCGLDEVFLFNGYASEYKNHIVTESKESGYCIRLQWHLKKKKTPLKRLMELEKWNKKGHPQRNGEEGCAAPIPPVTPPWCTGGMSGTGVGEWYGNGKVVVKLMWR